MKKLMKILLIILIIILVLLVSAVAFLKFYKPFGASPSKNDKADYAKRADNFDGDKFYNPDKFNMYTNWEDPYKNRTTGKGSTPSDELPYVEYEYTKPEKEDDVLITWFGHSTVLIQMHGLNILVDPIFDDIASPVSFAGPKRFSKLPAKISDLPDIDVVLLTHDHYDHVSYDTLKKLNGTTKRFIVPLGIDKDLEKFGIDKDKITNMAWWEELNIDGLTIGCTPSRHFSGRYILDSNDTLWSSWILKDEYNTIFDSGDTGYSQHFTEISEKYGDVTLALLDASQYNEKWHDVHMFPEESVRAALQMNAKIGMVVHNSAFVLSNHSWDDPLDRFTRYALENNLEYMQPKLGQTVNIKDYKDYQEKWWEDIN